MVCPDHGVLLVHIAQHEGRLDDHERRIRVNETFRIRGALLVVLLGVVLSGIVSVAITRLWPAPYVPPPAAAATVAQPGLSSNP